MDLLIVIITGWSIHITNKEHILSDSNYEIFIYKFKEILTLRGRYKPQKNQLVNLTFRAINVSRFSLFFLFWILNNFLSVRINRYDFFNIVKYFSYFHQPSFWYNDSLIITYNSSILVLIDLEMRCRIFKCILSTQWNPESDIAIANYWKQLWNIIYPHNILVLNNFCLILSEKYFIKSSCYQYGYFNMNNDVFLKIRFNQAQHKWYQTSNKYIWGRFNNTAKRKTYNYIKLVHLFDISFQMQYPVFKKAFLLNDILKKHS